MNPRVARAIKLIAQFHLFSDTAGKDSKFPVSTLRVPLLVSLRALEFPVQSVRSITRFDSLPQIAAHLHVRYGAFAMHSLYFWYAFQMLRSAVKHGPDPDTTSFELLLELFLHKSEEARLSNAIQQPVAALVTILSPKPPQNPDDWTQALDTLDRQIEPIASFYFGISQATIQYGHTEVPGLSYGEVYRLAIHSGVLRARIVFNPLTKAASHAQEQNGHEFYQVLNRLGVVISIPRSLRSIHRVLKNLTELDFSASTSPQALSDLFHWLETHLEIVYGGHTEVFHQIMYETESLRLAVVINPREFLEMIQNILGRLTELLEPFEPSPIGVIRQSIEMAIQEPTNVSRRWEDPTSVSAVMRTWLQRVAPTDEWEEEMLLRNKKIFLSHKSVNKPLVRHFRDVLIQFGFEPWLDEDKMDAGEVPLRAIHRGLKESCAAVFFITPEFQDEGWLSEEIDYALDRKREEGDRFSVITIVFRQDSKPEPVVPALLRRYVYKEPTSELEALTHIVRALPIKPGPVEWR